MNARTNNDIDTCILLHTKVAPVVEVYSVSWKRISGPDQAMTWDIQSVHFGTLSQSI